MPHKLPFFATVTEPELRALWTQHQDQDIRRLVLEVVRYRQVIKEIDELHRSIHQAWRDQVGGNLVALHMLFQVMTTERLRLPENVPAPHQDSAP